MSLLVQEVEARWQHKFDIFKKECESKLHAAEAGVRAAQAEKIVAVRRAELLAADEVARCQQRLADAEERERLLEARAAKAAQNALTSSQRAEERVKSDRSASEARIAELEREVDHVRNAASAQVADAVERARAAERRADRVEADAKARTEQSQQAARREIAEAIIRERQAVEAARSSCQLQANGVTERAARLQSEAQARVDQVVEDTNVRVDFANRRALAAQQRTRMDVVDDLQAFDDMMIAQEKVADDFLSFGQEQEVAVA